MLVYFFLSTSSMVAKYLQAKHFLIGSFLGAFPGHRPSFLWWSFLEGRNILSLGLRYCIGNVLSTTIGHSKWIQFLNGFAPSFYFLSRGPKKRVADLIDCNQCCWTEDRIRYLFLHHGTKAILQIPRNLSWPEDNIIWYFTLNEVYTVKSGYNIGMKFMKNPTPREGTSNSHQEIKLWNYIHQLPMQSKIRLFL